jgi:hypothetical protein
VFNLDNLGDEQRAKLAEIVHQAARDRADEALAEGRAVEFLIKHCGWTRVDVYHALFEL